MAKKKKAAKKKKTAKKTKKKKTAKKTAKKRPAKKKKSVKKKTAKKAKKKTSKKATKKKGKRKMAKAKSKKKKSGAKTKTIKKKMTPTELLIFSGLAALGGITSSLIVNFTPFIRDMKPIVKSLSQMGVGIVGTIFIPKKAEFLKPLAAGAGIAGTFGLVQKVSAGKFQVLAGNQAKTLTDQEIAALVAGGYVNMDGPARIGMNGMSGPVDLGKTVNPALAGQARNPAFMGAAQDFVMST